MKTCLESIRDFFLSREELRKERKRLKEAIEKYDRLNDRLFSAIVAYEHKTDARGAETSGLQDGNACPKCGVGVVEALSPFNSSTNKSFVCGTCHEEFD